MSNRPKKSSYSIEDLLQLKPSRSRPERPSGPPRRLLPTSSTGHLSKKVSFIKFLQKAKCKLRPGGRLKTIAHLKFNQPKLLNTTGKIKLL